MEEYLNWLQQDMDDYNPIDIHNNKNKRLQDSSGNPKIPKNLKFLQKYFPRAARFLGFSTNCIKISLKVELNISKICNNSLFFSDFFCLCLYQET